MAGHARKINRAPDYTGVQIQTSAMSLPVPLAWGLTRGSPNLIWMGDFATATKTVGKGGATGKTKETTYNASLILALCEGPITGINKTYINQGWESGYDASKFALFLGTTPQTAWSFLTTNHPADAFGYQGISYMGAAHYGLGTSEAIPSFSFEIKAPLYNGGAGGAGDADPALMAQDFLTNAQYGCLFPTTRLDLTTLLSSGAAPTTGDSAYQTYCTAMGFDLAPFIQNQEAAISILARWMQITNAVAWWTGFSLKFTPYGDEIVTANGVKYLPPNTPVFDFGDDDYYQGEGHSKADNDPVSVNIGGWFDAFNAIAIECRIRSYDYNTVPIDWIDQASSDLVGRRQASTISAHEICHTDMAFKVVSLIGARLVNLRNTYTFKMGPEYALYEPMDIGYITDSVAGLEDQPVRIRSIEEDDTGLLTFICEEYPGTVGLPTTATSGSPSPTVINSQVVPGAVNTPLIAEPNSLACAFLNGGSTAPLLIAAVSAGPSGTFDPNWGGANVFVSTDNTTFVPFEGVNGSTQIIGPSRQGLLTANLASYGGANPDAGHTLSVSLAESAGTLQTASSGSTAAAGATLCIIKDAGGSIELVGPQTATLTGANAYNLTNLYRGLFGTTAGAHVTNAQFARLDGGQFMGVLPAAYIGVTLYLKFQSFNIWGQAVEDLSTCTSYNFTPAGVGSGGGSGGVPKVPTGLAGATEGP